MILRASAQELKHPLRAASARQRCQVSLIFCRNEFVEWRRTESAVCASVQSGGIYVLLLMPICS